MPSRFVVEKFPPPKSPSRAKKERVLRENERPRYVLLTPGEIRKLFEYPDDPELEEADADTSDHPKKKKAPHPRRKHYRTYRSERFVSMQGRRVIIPGCWIGESEKIVDGRRYRVLFDR